VTLIRPEDFYKFKDLDVDMYLQDKEDLFHYKTDKLTTELTKIQEYINKTNRERISVSHVDKFLNDDNFLNQELFNSKTFRNEYSPNFIKSIK
jgi:hypothetical protein